MPVGYVGHVKDGLYSASIEYDSEAPFGCVIGPTDVGLDEAVAWARQRAQVVTVRTEDGTYTAGEVAYEPAARVEPDELWEVEGHVGSQAPELEQVALLLREAVERDDRTSHARHWLREWGFAVAFRIRCPSTDRYEIGSSVLRDSWAAAGISRDRIEPLSTTSVTVG
jgi:hypothetical protein